MMGLRLTWGLLAFVAAIIVALVDSRPWWQNGLLLLACFAWALLAQLFPPWRSRRRR